MTTPPRDWKEDFRERFVAKNPLQGSGYYYTVKPVKAENLEIFISSLLAKEYERGRQNTVCEKHEQKIKEAVAKAEAETLERVEKILFLKEARHEDGFCYHGNSGDGYCDSSCVTVWNECLKEILLCLHPKPEGEGKKE